ncbi:SH3 domain-containing YSC84-like protein 1 [Phytophthora pseudosyringae]|uniref:SH3 domain-containing YSC84-like protein 1 n=1 Tax=Phytophthora pseudosyringae TaxID=221518 RepID=A0A8T1V633_9STRA|nr:SH3 domain-containing YSC84-like protein 1 [Phytophthora pseudosyringae]
MVKFCAECGAQNSGGRFCSECGKRFADDSDSLSSSFVSGGSGAGPAVPVAAYQGAATAVASAFRSESSPYGGSSYQHNPLKSSSFNGSQSQPPPPPPPAFQPQPYARKSVPSAFRSSFNSASPPSAVPVAAAEPVPPAATGVEAQQVYERCVRTIRASRGGQNERGVKEFKQNCRRFGLKEMDVQAFYASLVAELGADGARSFVPTLARLVPDDDRRKELVEYTAQQRTAAFTSGNSSSGSNDGRQSALANRNPSMADSFRSDSTVSNSNNNAPQSKGVLNNRYADHPNCDVCNVRFDVTKRRHQCRTCGLFVCSSCSPVRLLVPPGKQIDGAKNYDPSLPQRVCIQCAPQLHPLQDELVATYAQSQTDNIHEARGRLHVPFTNSLNKECCNAADIIGNFFRNDWGASADRSIPVAFLQKAHGLAIMTVIKAGFLVSGKIGTGLVVAKLPDGSWSAPSAIGTFGLSGGFELGGELVEVMIILGSEGAVKVFHKPQVNLGAGLDIAVGPYGRSAQAAAAASTSGLNANYSYSQSKGLFAGISLQGAILAARSDLNRKFYGRDLQASELLTGFIEQPAAARPLYEAIDNAMQGIENHKEEQQRRSSVMGPCRLCNCPLFQAHTTQVWNKKCKTCNHAH